MNRTVRDLWMILMNKRHSQCL